MEKRGRETKHSYYSEHCPNGKMNNKIINNLCPWLKIRKHQTLPPDFCFKTYNHVFWAER